jgi:GxxExxY protein
VPEQDPRTYRIIGAAMAVHRALGPGLLEEVYQEALALEFEHLGIPYRREVPVAVVYRGKAVGSTRKMDFLCFESVAVELKAQQGLVDAHIAQTLHYMFSGGFRTGLLINFGAPSLEFRRLISGPANKDLEKPPLPASPI